MSLFCLNMTCLENVVVNQFFMIFFLDVEVVVDNEFIAFVFSIGILRFICFCVYKFPDIEHLQHFIGL